MRMAFSGAAVIREGNGTGKSRQRRKMIREAPKIMRNGK